MSCFSHEIWNVSSAIRKNEIIRVEFNFICQLQSRSQRYTYIRYSLFIVASILSRSYRSQLFWTFQLFSPRFLRCTKKKMMENQDWWLFMKDNRLLISHGLTSWCHIRQGSLVILPLWQTQIRNGHIQLLRSVRTWIRMGGGGNSVFACYFFSWVENKLVLVKIQAHGLSFSPSLCLA